MADPDKLESTHSRKGVGATFRKARELAGLSGRELASLLGTSAAAIRDIEEQDDELFSRYSPLEVGLMASALETSATRLVHCTGDISPVSGAELINRISDQIQKSRETIEAFENRVGWRIDGLLDSPEHLLADLTVDALQWLCEGLKIDWRQVMAGL